MKFPLTKAIKAHNEELVELDISKPTSKDIRELGYPFTALPNANGDADMRLLPDIGAKYIVRLCKIPMNSVDQLEPLDFMLLHTEICGFFGGEDKGKSKSEPLTSPTSGVLTPA